jgi:hypothetical protein
MQQNFSDFNGIVPSEPTGSGPYYYSDTSPSIRILVESVSVSAGATYSEGSYVQGFTKTINVTIVNRGGQNSTLFIPKGGISVSGSGSLTSDPVANTGKSIINSSSSSATFSVTINTLSVGSKEARIAIVSNDPNENPFRFKISFNIYAAENLPVISVFNNNVKVENNGTINAGEVPLGGISLLDFVITNLGNNNLVIAQNDIDIESSNDAVVFVDNPVSSGSLTLQLNASDSFSIKLDSSSLGSKTAIIRISSNDYNTTPFTINVVYSVMKSFNLIVAEQNNSFDDGETVDIGSFFKRDTIIKRIFLSNDGIYHNIRVLGVTGESGVSLLNIPALPFILQPNRLNIVQFQISFDSSSLGTKNGNIRIEWEVAS